MKNGAVKEKRTDGQLTWDQHVENLKKEEEMKKQRMEEAEKISAIAGEEENKTVVLGAVYELMRECVEAVEKRRLKKMATKTAYYIVKTINAGGEEGCKERRKMAYKAGKKMMKICDLYKKEGEEEIERIGLIIAGMEEGRKYYKEYLQMRKAVEKEEKGV